MRKGNFLTPNSRYPQNREGGVTCLIQSEGNYYSWHKEEVLSVDPWISVIYDVITDNEAEYLKATATPLVSWRCQS